MLACLLHTEDTWLSQEHCCFWSLPPIQMLLAVQLRIVCLGTIVIFTVCLLFLAELNVSGEFIFFFMPDGLMLSFPCTFLRLFLKIECPGCFMSEFCDGGSLTNATGHILIHCVMSQLPDHYALKNLRCPRLDNHRVWKYS